MFTAVTSPPPELPTYTQPSATRAVAGFWPAAMRCRISPVAGSTTASVLFAYSATHSKPGESAAEGAAGALSEVGGISSLPPSPEFEPSLSFAAGIVCPASEPAHPGRTPSSTDPAANPAREANALLVSARSPHAVHSEQPLPARFVSSQPMRRAFWPHVSMRPPPRDAQASPLPKRTPHPPGGRRLRRA